MTSFQKAVEDEANTLLENCEGPGEERAALLGLRAGVKATLTEVVGDEEDDEHKRLMGQAQDIINGLFPDDGKGESI